MAVTQGAFVDQLLPGLRDAFRLHNDPVTSIKPRTYLTDSDAWYIMAPEPDPGLLNWWDEDDGDYLHSE